MSEMWQCGVCFCLPDGSARTGSPGPARVVLRVRCGVAVPCESELSRHALCERHTRGGVQTTRPLGVSCKIAGHCEYKAWYTSLERAVFNTT